MSSRTLRINELVKRELADILRTRYQQEAVRITISDVDISPDLRNGRVFYSIMGSEADAYLAEQFFEDKAKDLKQQLFKRVIIKYTPNLEYIRDESLARGDAINRLIDDLDIAEPSADLQNPEQDEDDWED